MQEGLFSSLAPEGPQGGQFGNTDWWVVRRAGECGQSDTDSARARLCTSYWKPVFTCIRRAGYSPEDAEDLTQEFFLKLLKKNCLRSATREKGKFRSFLHTLLKRFLADQRDRAHCQKRGGGTPPISLESTDTEFRRCNEPVEPLNPETLCERAWARSLLDIALVQLQQEALANRAGKVFQMIKPLVLCETEETYATIARQLQMTESNVKVTVHRLRRRLRELLRAKIEQSGMSSRSVDAELHALYIILAN